MDIRGKRVLLTGASGGIGTPLAQRLAAAGARLALVGRRREALEALAGDIPSAALVVADLGSDSVSLAYQPQHDAGGRVVGVREHLVDAAARLDRAGDRQGVVGFDQAAAFDLDSGDRTCIGEFD